MHISIALTKILKRNDAAVNPERAAFKHRLEGLRAALLLTCCCCESSCAWSWVGGKLAGFMVTLHPLLLLSQPCICSTLEGVYRESCTASVLLVGSFYEAWVAEQEKEAFCFIRSLAPVIPIVSLNKGKWKYLFTSVVCWWPFICSP